MAKHTKIPIGKFSGDRKKLIKKMFNDTGKITKFANATNLLTINEIPHKSSIAFAKGIIYSEATSPALKALKLPVASGSGANFKKNITEAKIRSAPNKILTIVVVNFIMN
ncbi:MAG: hypothetical protein V4670_00900 [Bacteroidota bacterium]